MPFNPGYLIRKIAKRSTLDTGGPSSRLEKANDEFMNASRVVWLGIKLREEPLKIWTRYKG